MAVAGTRSTRRIGTRSTTKGSNTPASDVANMLNSGPMLGTEGMLAVEETSIPAFFSSTQRDI